jgi:hypothetical protein
VIHGYAPESLLDTYEQDRLPVMRNVLFKTENLTEIIGAENHLVRTLFNHIGPWVGGASAMQENSTNHMAQVALGYRDSPLSDNHTHAGALRAGDRVPELGVRQGRGGETVRLHSLLDPSGFVLLVAHGNEATPIDAKLQQAVSAASAPIAIMELTPPSGDEAAAYQHELGLASNVFLIRPDGYVAVAAGTHTAPAAIESFIRKWLTVDQAVHR